MSEQAKLAWVCASALAIFTLWLATDRGANAGLGFFYAVPVGMAAWWFGSRVAVVAVAGSCVLYSIGALIDPVDNFEVALPLRLAAWGGVAAVVSILRERVLVLEHSADELEAIRSALTPGSLPELPDVDAAAAFIPSELGVSGDFYLLTNAPDGATVAIVGDVVGHGPEAARLATFIRARFAANTSDPAELLMMANRELIDRPGRRRRLVSAVCLRFRADGSRLSWAMAGHPPPLRMPGLDELECEDETFLLGAEAGLDLSNGHTELNEGDGVIVYTDGATDVRREDSLLGLGGLARLLEPLTHLPASTMVARVEREILDWADSPIRDDLCVLVLRPRQGPAS